MSLKSAAEFGFELNGPGGHRVVVGVPESDCHVVALTILGLELRERGYVVHNLGVCTSVDEFVEASRSPDTLAIVISSMNGHAMNDLDGLRARLEAEGLGHLPIFLGGNLTVGSSKDPAETCSAFAAVGISVLDTFDEVIAVLGELAEVADIARGRPAARAWG